MRVCARVRAASVYTFVNTVGTKVNTYNFYISMSGAPVQYHWLGYGVLGVAWLFPPSPPPPPQCLNSTGYSFC
jgi:hypothetical protein